jgi:hypothetical protein
MRRFVLAAVVLSLVVAGQGAGELPVPEARTVRGVVVDESGAIVAKARIDHVGIPAEWPMTDEAGRFAVSTRAPLVVVRADGYESAVLRIGEGGEVRVVLRRAGEAARYPRCKEQRGLYGLLGFPVMELRFRRMAGVKATRQANDADYGVRHYLVKAKEGWNEIVHGGGVHWSSGRPLDSLVWGSEVYEDRRYAGNGYPVMDVRGRLADGSRWRHVGKVFETAAYSGVDEETARRLDRFLDGGCLVDLRGRE